MREAKGWGVWHVNDQVKWINRKFSGWCEKYPKAEFVVIPGNHDLFAQRDDVPTKVVWPSNVHFIVDRVVEVKGLRIAGSPWIPPISGRWAFETRDEADLASHFAWIPDGVDILITHTPPFVADWNVDVSLQTQSPHFGSRALAASARQFWYTYIQMMQKIDRKEFVQGIAALGVATAAGISFGKEGNDMKKTEMKTLASENAFDLIGKEWMLVTAGNKEKLPQALQVADGRRQLHRQVDSREVVWPPAQRLAPRRLRRRDRRCVRRLGRAQLDHLDCDWVKT